MYSSIIKLHIFQIFTPTFEINILLYSDIFKSEALYTDTSIGRFLTQIMYSFLSQYLKISPKSYKINICYKKFWTMNLSLKSMVSFTLSMRNNL